MARPERFELPASAFGGQRSIQLSYGRFLGTGSLPSYCKPGRCRGTFALGHGRGGAGMDAITPEIWGRIEELFHAALELPPRRSPEFLRKACPDPALRREVEQLLAASDTVPPLLEGGIVARRTDAPAPPARELEAGSRIGAYRIERLLGRGGMGE